MSKDKGRRGAEEAIKMIQKASADSMEGVLKTLKDNLGKTIKLNPMLFDMIETGGNVRSLETLNKAKLDVLTEDIRANGVRQNIEIDLIEEGDGTFRLQCVAGQRRILAVKALYEETKNEDVKRIMAKITPFVSRQDQILRGLMENIARDDLHPMDTAEAVTEFLKQVHGRTDFTPGDKEIKAFGAKVGRSTKYLLRLVKVASFPADVKKQLRRRMITMRTITTLGSKHYESNDHLRDEVRKELEALKAARQKTVPQATTKTAGKTRVEPPQFARRMTSALSERGFKAKVQGTEDKGKVVINYKTPEMRAKLEEILSSI